MSISTYVGTPGLNPLFYNSENPIYQAQIGLFQTKPPSDLVIPPDTTSLVDLSASGIIQIPSPFHINVTTKNIECIVSGVYNIQVLIKGAPATGNSANAEIDLIYISSSLDAPLTLAQQAFVCPPITTPASYFYQVSVNVVRYFSVGDILQVRVTNRDKSNIPSPHNFTVQRQFTFLNISQLC